MKERKTTFWIGAAASLLLAAVVLVACSRKQDSPVTKNEFETMAVRRQAIDLSRRYTASLKGKQDVEIRPQVSGTITRICVSEGAIVRKGQPLFVIDQVPYQAALETAEANVKVAKANVATADITAQSKDNLYNKNIISNLDRQTASNTLNANMAQLALARAELKNARNNLSYTVVKSPVDGKIGMITYKVGALVGPQMETALTTVSDNSCIYAYFSMTENEVLAVSRESGSLENALDDMPAVRLALSDGSMYQFEGDIDAVGNTVDSSTGAVSLRATFPNKNHLLASGGSATVVLPYKLTDCIVIPQTATYEVQDKMYVYKVVDGRAKATLVGIMSIDDGQHYVVTSGLKPGDTIIAKGAANVKDGMAVSIKKSK